MLVKEIIKVDLETLNESGSVGVMEEMKTRSSNEELLSANPKTFHVKDAGCSKQNDCKDDIDIKEVEDVKAPQEENDKKSPNCEDGEKKKKTKKVNIYM